MSREVDIPVRRFFVEVVDTLELRSAPQPTAAAVTNLEIESEAFLLVLAPIVRPPRLISINGSPPAAETPNPVTRMVDPGEETAAFLGVWGTGFRVSFPTGSEKGVHVITVDVGTSAASIPLTCSFTLA